VKDGTREKKYSSNLILNNKTKKINLKNLSKNIHQITTNKKY
jgi:hypothetical protein